MIEKWVVLNYLQWQKAINFVEINQELDRIWDGRTYESTSNVIIFMCLVWTIFVFHTLFVERSIKIEADKTKSMTKVGPSIDAISSSSYRIVHENNRNKDVIPKVEKFGNNFDNFDILDQHEKDLAFTSYLMNYVHSIVHRYMLRIMMLRPNHLFQK